jgi:hypothetical protein
MQYARAVHSPEVRGAPFQTSSALLRMLDLILLFLSLTIAHFVSNHFSLRAQGKIIQWMGGLNVVDGAWHLPFQLSVGDTTIVVALSSELLSVKLGITPDVFAKKKKAGKKDPVKKRELGEVSTAPNQSHAFTASSALNQSHAFTASSALNQSHASTASSRNQSN